jgi:large subunit ribosomal protein L3
MKAILGRKIGMSQMFSSDGEQVGVTLISCEPNSVALVRIKDRDGYSAVQLALPKKKVENAEKKNTGKGKKKPKFAARREFRLDHDDGEKKTFNIAQFDVGDRVEVVGVSKGKGFQGVVKRHGFKGGPASHGHRHVLRSPGSIGSAFPQHVLKGKKMAGRMGGDQVTVKNLRVVWIDEKKNVMAVSGAVPGAKGSVVEIRADAKEDK